MEFHTVDPQNSFFSFQPTFGSTYYSFSDFGGFPGARFGIVDTNGYDVADFSAFSVGISYNGTGVTFPGGGTPTNSMYGINEIIGTEFGDRLVGADSYSAPFVFEHVFNDTFRGGGGNDTLDGRVGDDFLFGGDGRDYLYGGADQDQLFGGAGNDFMIGGAGNDRLHGDDGFDFLSGGGGEDRIRGGEGNDVIFGGSGRDIVVGDGGNDNVIGGADNDTVHGGFGDDQLFGDAGNDLLFGEGGDDDIYGGSGRDRLYGQDGDNRLFGGSGSDTFVFSTFGNAGDLTVIKDFARWVDKIDFAVVRTASNETIFSGRETDSNGDNHINDLDDDWRLTSDGLMFIGDGDRLLVEDVVTLYVWDFV